MLFGCFNRQWMFLSSMVFFVSLLTDTWKWHDDLELRKIIATFAREIENEIVFMKILAEVKQWLGRFSFRTGVIVLLCCIPCYILSFAQMALPISVEMKGVLWFVLFGMAKTFQYGGLTILGVEGVKRLKERFKRSWVLDAGWCVTILRIGKQKLYERVFCKNNLVRFMMY